jgi:hypothetical protein
MRVSPEFYELVAPHLYHDVVLDDPKEIENFSSVARPRGTLFYDSKSGSGLEAQVGKKVPSKLEIMQHIQYVTVRPDPKNHWEGSRGFKWTKKFTDPYFPRLQMPIDITTMTIHVPRTYHY